ncbi:hypothetical protein C2S53_004992 [Perilla frutescens var. hirtella]|uniref:Uncharacterized protein n=1 Tax=Perilla frutescens var. hirtella TaxID=608512 RepID=A0AAD4IXR2_PERFH|nr:hypothetical protein C2S53_004992 [Perilla frutescens var. hirtella]
MQSRFALTAAKYNRTLLSGVGKQRIRSGATTSGRTADPAAHAVQEEDVYPNDAIDNETRQRPPENEPMSKDNEPYIPPKSPKQTAAKLESLGVGPRSDPIAQQKRRCSAAAATAKIDDVSCAGLDGSPWPAEDGRDRRRQREEQERDDKEYYKHRKASPLSEIEICDTRKPLTQATDGTVQNRTVGYDGNYGDGVWRPEQLDTAEDSLRRAVEIFKMNAIRGDPDSPHGRVLRQLRGEYW